MSGWLEAGPRHPERVVGSSSPGPEGGMVENGGCGVAFSAASGVRLFVWWGTLNELLESRTLTRRVWSC